MRVGGGGYTELNIRAAFNITRGEGGGGGPNLVASHSRSRFALP